MVIFSACNKSGRATYYDHKTLESISKLAAIEPVPPAIIGSTSVFVLSESDSIIVTRFPNLEQVYSTSYRKSHSNFADFLFSALNQNLKLNTSNLSVRLLCEHIFNLDPAISSIYEKEKVNGLIRRYVLPNRDGYTLKKDGMSLNQINSVSYYFFINQFIRQDDDYNASIHFRKLSTALGDMGEN